ncbi:unnamed protein product [Linum tenue]|uniref:Non-specific lipid-transfer protein n=1 Tax=Linum tenue TaxID=586396 RepID=A0AAV0K5R0_9ROSI|nr:unnamed protein product [Linum tenue]
MKGATAAVLVISMLAMIQAGDAAISCGQVDGDLAPCIPYLTTGAGDPASKCCDGIRSLKASTATVDDRRAACACVKAAADHYPVKEDAASSLPTKCGVAISIPISKAINCQRKRVVALSVCFPFYLFANGALYATLIDSGRVFCKKGCNADGDTWEECLEACEEICYKDPVLKDQQWSAYIDRSPGAASYSEFDINKDKVDQTRPNRPCKPSSPPEKPPSSAHKPSTTIADEQEDVPCTSA